MKTMIDEVWQDVPNCPGYQASTNGRIRSFKWGAERILKTQTARSGHQRVSISNAGVSRPQLIHQLVLQAFVGPCPDGMLCRHLNGDPADNRLSNLAWGTASENVRDAVLHGGHPQSSKTRCPNEHEYDQENTYWHRGERHCRKCRAAARKRHAAKKVAA